MTLKTRSRIALLTLALSVSLLATTGAVAETNPPAEGFDLAHSDAKAIHIADQVMQAMGGRKAWDQTRHLRWRFFGRRLHIWDKHSGNLRLEGTERDSGESYVILMNLAAMTGRAWREGSEITATDELTAMLERGEAMWINDSYWMFMPYKLKDSGVTLNYLAEGELDDGRAADILELTFRDVGRTPENKYHIFVSRDRHLVERWAYFEKATEAEPRFYSPWANWQRYGSILLSDNRGDNGHTELAVFDTLPDSVYTDPAPIDWSAVE